MNQNEVKEILFGSGIRPASEEARAGILAAVKQVIDQLLEEIAAKIKQNDIRLREEQGYMMDSGDCAQMIRWYKSGSRGLFECKHETKLANSKTLRVTCADCGASLNGPAEN